MRRLWTALSAVGVFAATQGCASIHVGPSVKAGCPDHCEGTACSPSCLHTHFCYFPFLDDCLTKHSARCCADHRLQAITAETGEQFSSDFEVGFRAAYVDLSLGGMPVVPAVPPQRYWQGYYRSPTGKLRANDWFAGYTRGLDEARAGGVMALTRVASTGKAYIAPQDSHANRGEESADEVDETQPGSSASQVDGMSSPAVAPQDVPPLSSGWSAPPLPALPAAPPRIPPGAVNDFALPPGTGTPVPMSPLPVMPMNPTGNPTGGWSPSFPVPAGPVPTEPIPTYQPPALPNAVLPNAGPSSSRNGSWSGQALPTDRAPIAIPPAVPMLDSAARRSPVPSGQATFGSPQPVDSPVSPGPLLPGIGSSEIVPASGIRNAPVSETAIYRGSTRSAMSAVPRDAALDRNTPVDDESPWMPEPAALPQPEVSTSAVRLAPLLPPAGLSASGLPSSGQTGVFP